jgi:hypothetical protein
MVMARKPDSEVAELRAEIEVLKAEVAALKAVPWWQQMGGGVAYWPQAAPQCSCQTSRRCMVHHPQEWTTVCLPPQNVCGVAAGVAQTQIMDTMGATTMTVTPAIGAAAGCAPMQAFWVNG